MNDIAKFQHQVSQASDQAFEEHMSAKNTEIELELTQAFNDFDLNRDDALDRHEFRQLMKACMLHRRSENRELRFAKAKAFITRLVKQQLLSFGNEALAQQIWTVVERILCDELSIMEKEVQKLNSEYELNVLSGKHPIADKVFEELSSDIPDQVLLPDFVTNFLGKRRSMDKQFLQDPMKSLQQRSMSRLLEKILAIVLRGGA